MKTILVVFTSKHLSVKEVTNNKLQKYSFRTDENLEVGDMIRVKSYSTTMQVTDIIEEDYKYYNSSTGELRNTINSTKYYPIKKLVLKEEDELTMYGTKID